MWNVEKAVGKAMGSIVNSVYQQKLAAKDPKNCVIYPQEKLNVSRYLIGLTRYPRPYYYY